MKSPRDQNATLVQTQILPGLDAHICPTSGGVWIDVIQYWDWFRTQPGFPKPLASFESPRPVDIDDDHNGPVLSPRTGRLMRKCRVGSGLGFRIDFEPQSGFWLDRGEYESLKEHNLHDELHLICSPEYQLALVRMQTSESEQSRFERKLGTENCDRISSFAKWFARLGDHPVAMAYLMSCIEHEQGAAD
jgi:Zn-finger nucleic acid-binding protein